MFSVYIEEADHMDGGHAGHLSVFSGVHSTNMMSETNRDSLNRASQISGELSSSRRLPPIKEVETHAKSAATPVSIGRKPWENLYSSSLAKRRPDANTPSTAGSALSHQTSVSRQRHQALKANIESQQEPIRNARVPVRAAKESVENRGVRKPIVVEPVQLKPTPEITPRLVNQMNASSAIRRVQKSCRRHDMKTASFLERTMVRKELIRSKSEASNEHSLAKIPSSAVARNTTNRMSEPATSRSNFSNISLISHSSSRHIRLKAPTDCGLGNNS